MFIKKLIQLSQRRGGFIITEKVGEGIFFERNMFCVRRGRIPETEKTWRLFLTQMRQFTNKFQPSEAGVNSGNETNYK